MPKITKEWVESNLKADTIAPVFEALLKDWMRLHNENVILQYQIKNFKDDGK